jgi:hypothetical protein
VGVLAHQRHEVRIVVACDTEDLCLGYALDGTGVCKTLALVVDVAALRCCSHAAPLPKGSLCKRP